ncbi:MAG: CsbD family protein [Sulfuricaulis sp.]
MGINKDQVKGRVVEAKGNVNEVTGKLVGNEKLEAKGKVQKIVGEAQAKLVTSSKI